MNNVEACNLALSRCGHGAQQAIQSLSENTEKAQVCARVFPSALRAVLAEFPWPFARVSVALAENTFDPPSGWAYSYAMPADAMNVRYVESEGFIPDWLGLNDQRNGWEVMADPSADGRILVSNVPDAWCYYTKAITELLYADELVADAVAWRVAGEIALGLKADAKLAQWAGQFYTQALDKAVAVAMNQRGGQIRQQAESVSVRGATPDRLGPIYPVAS